jgi:hypothetical protein
MRLVPGRQFAVAAAALQRRQLIDAAAGAYTDWRTECIGVEDAYRRWTGSPNSNAACAFSAYRDALDREEGAARVYGGLMVALARHRNQARSQAHRTVDTFRK